MRVSSKAFEFKDKYLLSKTYSEVDDDNVNEDGSLKEEAKQQNSSAVLLDFTN